jgi:hypothetical protein
MDCRRARYVQRPVEPAFYQRSPTTADGYKSRGAYSRYTDSSRTFARGQESAGFWEPVDNQ